MNTTMNNSHECDTDAMNVLLRGEMSAVETYTQAMGKFDDETTIADLQKIRDEHSRSVRVLRDQVIAFGAHPAEAAGPWGAFTAVVTGGAKAIGPAAALAALRQGEEHEINEYQSALDNGDIHPDCQRLIRADLLPACRRHVDELNRLLGGMNR